MRILGGYLLRGISAAMLGALIKALCPEKGAGRVVKLSVGLVLILSVLSPVLKLDADQIAAYFAQTQIIGEQASTGVEIPTADLAAGIISRKVRTYVLDKATELGVQIEVEVSMQLSGAYPYPNGIHITGSMSSIQRQELERYIEDVLAIPADRQVYDQ